MIIISFEAYTLYNIKYLMESEKDKEIPTCETSGGVHDRLKNHFRAAVSKTVEKFLSSFSFKLFSRYYPQIHAEDSIHLMNIHKQLVSQLKMSILEDIKLFSKEMRVAPSLVSLDAAIQKHQDQPGSHSWRPSGDPESDFKNHLFKIKLKQKEKLLELLKDLEQERKDMQVTVDKNHQEILDIKREIDDKNAKLLNHLHAGDISAVDEEEAVWA